MKKTIATLLLIASATPCFSQKVGDAVTPEALGKIAWIKGEAPTAWEPGKVYVIECWATWCAPCIAAIPHVDELHDKYAEKGLKVIGVNVAEDDEDKVANFVKEKGDGMSYPVAFTGKGGAFETDWLKPGGVTGIPHSFVVKDGKVILATHPSKLTDKVIEGLLAGGEDQTKAIKSLEGAEKNQGELVTTMQEFAEAGLKRDAAAMEVALKKIKELDPTNPNLSTLDLQISIAKSDWAAVETGLKTLPPGQARRMLVLFVAQRSAPDPKAPEAFKDSVTAELGELIEKDGQPYEFQILAGVHWDRGNREAALVAAKRTAETAKALGATDRNIPVAAYVRFAETVERGEMPTIEQMNQWTGEAMQQRSRPGD